MPLFHDRERGYEAKFAHDLELHFRARIGAIRMLAAWAAARMALIGAPAHDFEAAIVDVAIHHRNEDMPIARIAAELKRAGSAVEPHVLKMMFDGFLARIMAEMIAPEVEAGGIKATFAH